ncbi:MAG: HYR domain-containing protein, partial [Bacteroidales bacterium]
MLLKVYKSRVWLLLLMLLPLLGTAQIPGLPTGWGFTENPSTHIIAVPTTVTFDGIASLQANDWVGAFYNDGGTLKCGGAAQWTGAGNIAVVVNGNDTLEAVKNGFYTNELINWKFYRTATSAEVCVKAYDAGNLELHWVALGLSQISKFTADPVVTCPTYATPFCVNAAAFALAGGTPVGGTYAGPGVSGGIFTPATAGVGVHTITYTYTNAYGCANSCSFTISVVALPSVTCPANMTGVKDNDPSFTLTGGTPTGGVYTGTGVSGGVFTPSVAGIGTHTITYTYTDGNGCSNFCTFTIQVIAGTICQNINLIGGASRFYSSYIQPADLNFKNIMTDVLDNLSIAKNSTGATLRKVGVNWINGIGNWVVTEGYSIRMNGNDVLTVCGQRVPYNTPIALSAATTKFVAYLHDVNMNAVTAFASILPNMAIAKNSTGATLRKVGANWINGIGNLIPGEGYSVRMNTAGTLVYPAVPADNSAFGHKDISNQNNNNPNRSTHFAFIGGDASDNTWSIYIDVVTLNGIDLEAGDEIAIFDGTKIVGLRTLNATPVPGELGEELAAFKTLGNGTAGYTPGNAISFKCWDASTSTESTGYDVSFTDFGGSYMLYTFPATNNEYSVATLTFTAPSGCVNPPTANAGIDASICAGSTYTLSNATATNYTSLLWTTSGTGAFSNSTILNPVYTPGAGDASVTLTLTASKASCPNATDAMVLTVNALPTANCPSYNPVCAG